MRKPVRARLLIIWCPCGRGMMYGLCALWESVDQYSCVTHDCGSALTHLETARWKMTSWILITHWGPVGWFMTRLPWKSRARNLMAQKWTFNQASNLRLQAHLYCLGQKSLSGTLESLCGWFGEPYLLKSSGEGFQFLLAFQELFAELLRDSSLPLQLLFQGLPEGWQTAVSVSQASLLW